MTVSRTEQSIVHKLKVALKAIKTTAELTSEHGVHATQINKLRVSKCLRRNK